jgi:hypothetical protein
VRPSRAAAAEARRRLAASGLTGVLYAVAPETQSPHPPHNETIEAGLLEIAAYIGSNNPGEIAAAAILEASGYERSQLTLPGC